MIADTNASDVAVAVITGGMLFAGTLVTVFFSNRKTRVMNTAEHERSAQERADNRDAVLAAISIVHDEVKDQGHRLDAHIREDHMQGV